MKPQNYSNHRKFYAPHHFIYLPLLGILLILGIWKSVADEPHRLVWMLFSAIIFLLVYLALMVRQHYALGNQDRIIRLEFKQRYYELFQKRSDEVVEKLSFSQIAALRFAEDEEFTLLLDKALNEHLPGDAIKKSITKWRPDDHRV
ncbi:DUF6526 family protein [Chryseobacterium sp.]|uniref:DUF6526 family protein n=1 Tax=Chryseobacterium sp. TaxID=1871047 RepID=UPI0011C8AF1C|nr:DUF6526 family protein [Chryseobacterium sp.]TXF74914.1 hypothetical protein FUA25_11545 [Chryseobacterium sp.]